MMRAYSDVDDADLLCLFLLQMDSCELQRQLTGLYQLLSVAHRAEGHPCQTGDLSVKGINGVH